MRNYESEMEHASAASGEKASGKELLGEMHEIYYGNRFYITMQCVASDVQLTRCQRCFDFQMKQISLSRDLRLLLDLLAATTGLAPPLRFGHSYLMASSTRPLSG